MSVILQKPVSDIIKQLALEFNVSAKSVQEIVMSQFEYVVDEMEKGNPGDEDSYKTVLLKYFGTFTFLKKKHTAIGFKLKKIEDEKHNPEL
jgi:nucleoid DNA-binding protein